MQRPSPRFRSEEYFVYEISEEMFYPNLQRFLWRRHAGAKRDEFQHGGRKPTETSVTEFCCKSVNLFFEKLINIQVILFLIHEQFTFRFCGAFPSELVHKQSNYFYRRLKDSLNGR